MDFSNDFNVDLVSNGSMKIYPDNTLSKFQNYFDPAINLDGEWEAAMTEIHFPLKFSDPVAESIKFGFEMEISHTLRREISENEFMNYTFSPIKIKKEFTSNMASSIETITEEINNHLTSAFSEYEFKSIFQKKTVPQLTYSDRKFTLVYGKYESDSGWLAEASKGRDSSPWLQKLVRAYVNSKDPHKSKHYIPNIVLFDQKKEADGKSYKISQSVITYIYFNDATKNFLSITNPIEMKMENDALTQESFSWDYKKIDKQIFLMYVYTDIIRDHLVAGTLAPILRAVPLTKGIYEGVGYCTFEHLVYYPVRKNFIETIAIMLTHDDGEQVRFSSEGRVFLSLHFRKKSV